MKASIIRIGNSKGVRIPKPLLDQCRLEGIVELEARGGELVLRPAKSPRTGWGEAFKRMAQEGDDALLDGDSRFETRWARKNWRW